jgi:hypothetical protein
LKLSETVADAEDFWEGVAMSLFTVDSHKMQKRSGRGDGLFAGVAWQAKAWISAMYSPKLVMQSHKWFANELEKGVKKTDAPNF